MSQKDKSEGIFRPFWSEIIDLESAKKAANYGAFVSGFLCLGYIIQILFLYFYGKLLFSNNVPSDGIEFYIYLVTFTVVSLFLGYSSFVIYKKKKYGFIPYISVWAIIEVVYKFFLLPGKGIILSIIISFFALNAFRGWLGIRKFKKTEDSEGKKKRSWVKFLGISIASIFFFFFLIGVLTETSLLPNTDVQKGSELSEKDKIALINHKIVDKNDNILFFYSEGFLSILEGGQLITNDKIIVYAKNEEQLLDIYEMSLNNVKEIVLEEKGSFFSDSIYKIIGDGNSKYEFIRIFLSIESNKDQDFINAIKKRIN